MKVLLDPGPITGKEVVEARDRLALKRMGCDHTYSAVCKDEELVQLHCTNCGSGTTMMKAAYDLIPSVQNRSRRKPRKIKNPGSQE